MLVSICGLFNPAETSVDTLKGRKVKEGKPWIQCGKSKAYENEDTQELCSGVLHLNKNVPEKLAFLVLGNVPGIKE